MPASNKSKEVRMQQLSIEPPKNEAKIRVTIQADTSHEYHMVMAESVVKHIIDPDTHDAFIEVPTSMPGVKHHFMHTSRIGHFYIHDELTPDEGEE